MFLPIIRSQTVLSQASDNRRSSRSQQIGFIAVLKTVQAIEQIGVCIECHKLFVALICLIKQYNPTPINLAKVLHAIEVVLVRGQLIHP